MCLHQIHQTYNPPRQGVVKAYKLFHYVQTANGNCLLPICSWLINGLAEAFWTASCADPTKKMLGDRFDLDTHRLNLDVLPDNSGYELNQWIDDPIDRTLFTEMRFDTDREIMANSRLPYKTGFHAFKSVEDAQKFLKAWGLGHSSIIKIYEVELDCITVEGTQYGLGEKLPCVVARKMKINHRIDKVSVVEIKGSCA